MKGLVDQVDPSQRRVDGQGVGVDFLALRDDARDRAEAAGDAHRADVGIGRQGAGEHLGVEFVRLAVHVQPGAREVGPQKRRAEGGGFQHQCVDAGVFRAADRLTVEARGGEEVLGVATAAVRRTQDDRKRAAPGRNHFEGWQAGEFERRFHLVPGFDTSGVVVAPRRCCQDRWGKSTGLGAGVRLLFTRSLLG